jgi:hypothetical protein
MMTPGTQGRERVLATTAVAFLTHWCWVVARYSYDPVTMVRNGLNILMEGLYNSTQDMLIKRKQKKRDI